MSKYWNIATPLTVHVEITNKCNEKCIHCYNFSRAKKFTSRTISQENLEYVISELIANKVMHVIVTGGEPFLALDKAIYLTKEALKAGMSVSLNSNLKAATTKRLLLLKEAGISHILTTIHSHKKEIHDYITCTPGSFDKTVENIRLAQKLGIRITVNTILNQYNKDDIYEIGKFVHTLGVGKFLGNRTIASPSNDQSLKKDFSVERNEVVKMFNDLLRLKMDLGIQVGTCRAVPHCIFDELEKYSDFIPRGCSGGKKYVLLNVNGDAHACTSDDTIYGNIYEIGLKGIWEKMRVWRTLDFIPKGCQVCRLFDECDAGCRMMALAHTGRMDGFDCLRRGAGHIEKGKKETTIREEDGFCVLRTGVGAKFTFVDRNENSSNNSG